MQINQIVASAVIFVFIVAIIGHGAAEWQHLFILLFLMFSGFIMLFTGKIQRGFWLHLLILIGFPTLLLILFSEITRQCQAMFP